MKNRNLNRFEMDTKTLIVFLLATCFFISCSKPETFISNPATKSTFTIIGVHDMAFDTSGHAVLALAVKDVTGDTQQSVSVGVSGLPRGILPTIKPHTGTTDFTTSITLSYDGVYDTAAPGTYPLKIIGESASDTETYDCKLTIPPYNGFRLNYAFMRTASMSHTTDSVKIRSQIYAGTLVGYNPAGWPTADGTYTYMVGGTASSSVNFTYIPKSYATIWTHDQGGADTVIVTISGGKMSIKSGVLHTKGQAYPNTITINASE